MDKSSIKFEKNKNSEKEGEIVLERKNSSNNSFLSLLEKENRGQTYKSSYISSKAKLSLSLIKV